MLRFLNTNDTAKCVFTLNPSCILLWGIRAVDNDFVATLDIVFSALDGHSDKDCQLSLILLIIELLLTGRFLVWAYSRYSTFYAILYPEQEVAITCPGHFPLPHRAKSSSLLLFAQVRGYSNNLQTLRSCCSAVCSVQRPSWAPRSGGNTKMS